MNSKKRPQSSKFPYAPKKLGELPKFSRQSNYAQIMQTLNEINHDMDVLGNTLTGRNSYVKPDIPRAPIREAISRPTNNR